MRKLLYFTVFAHVFFLLAVGVFAQGGGGPAPIAWQKSLGGSELDVGRSVARALDSNFVVLGTTYSSDGDITLHYGETDIWLAKLDRRDGNLLWQITYGTNLFDEARHILPLPDGTYLIGGTTQAPADMNQWWIIKTNGLGNQLWEKTFGGSSSDVLAWIDTTGDSSFFCAGHSQSTDGDFPENKGGYDIWVAKMNPQGVLLWKKNVGGSGQDIASMIHSTSDGGVILAGTTSSQDGDMLGNHGSWDGVVIKFDNAGNVEWKKLIGTPSADSLNAIEVNANGTIGVCGVSSNADPNGDFYVAQFDANSNVQWEKFYGGSGHDAATKLIEGEGNGYQVIGTSSSVIDSIPGKRGGSDWLFYRLNPDGSKRLARWFGGSADELSGSTIATNLPGGYITAGTTYSSDKDVTANHGNGDIWVVRYGNVPNNVRERADNALKILPNPSNDHIMITLPEFQGNYVLTVSNTAGTEVIRSVIRYEPAYELDLRLLPDGTYMIGISNGKRIIAREKFVKD